MKKGTKAERYIEIQEIREKTTLQTDERAFRITRLDRDQYRVEGQHIDFTCYCSVKETFTTYDLAHRYIVDFIYNHSK
jgi:hypothetical protein